MQNHLGGGDRCHVNHASYVAATITLRWDDQNKCQLALNLTLDLIRLVFAILPSYQEHLSPLENSCQPHFKGLRARAGMLDFGPPLDNQR